MAALTLSQLVRLVRLHRAGVDGAAAHLETLILSQPGDLTRLLDVPGLDVDVLREEARRVEFLVQWVENAHRYHGERSARDGRRRAEELALSVVASRGYGQEVDLDLATLDALVGCRGFDWMFFDRDLPVGLERHLVRRVLHSLADTDVTSSVLAPDRLHLEYATEHGGGRFELMFRPLPRHRTVLYVPAFETPVLRAAEEQVVVQPRPDTPRQAEDTVTEASSGRRPTSTSGDHSPARRSRRRAGRWPLSRPNPAASTSGLRRFFAYALEALS